MQRFLEIILGLERGFLGKEGEFALGFNPRWPFQDVLGAATWNLALSMLAVALVIYVYRREGRGRIARIALGGLRLTLLAFVIAMLNRPVLTLRQSRSEPSVLAVLIDNSISMSVRDAGKGADGLGLTRLAAVVELLDGDHQRLLRDLAQRHQVRLYSFGRDAQPLSTVTREDLAQSPTPSSMPTTAPSGVAAGLEKLAPSAPSTQILASLRTVLQDLQGKRLAGIVLLTDGRDTPSEAVAENLPEVLSFARNVGTRVYPIAIGAEKAPQNVTVEGIDMQDAAFARDIVSAKVHVRAMGYPSGHDVTVVLKNKLTGMPLTRSGGKPAEQTVTFNADGSQEVEINFKPGEVGTLQVVAEAIKQPGELDDQDNTFPAQIAVLDAKISVLYCEGYPRWEYRYLKNEMIRDSTVDISCLLFSADAGFAQEGDKAITRFPESMSEMLSYDVVVFGDVDPRQLTDGQLQLVSDFVAQKNGGFGMIGGPRWAPYAFRNTPIEAILPIAINRTPPEVSPNLTTGWRPILTKDGQSSTIFRFFEDKQQNDRFIREDIQPLFWYCQGITSKPGVGEVYAEHPFDTGPDGRKAPILVLGRYGGGRTLFSAIDDSWRWRFYTGESIFDTYWVQQLRYLARARKLGQRRFMLNTLRPAYVLGEQVQVSLRVLDPDLLKQLPDQISVILTQQAPDGTDQPVRQETLQRQEGQPELYVTSWTADRAGQFALKLPALAGNAQATELPVVVKNPRLELLQPQVDTLFLSKLRDSDDPNQLDAAKLVLADESNIPIVRSELAKIASAAQNFDVLTNELLWNAPLAMVIFVLLIVAEWILRKAYGML